MSVFFEIGFGYKKLSVRDGLVFVTFSKFFETFETWRKRN